MNLFKIFKRKPKVLPKPVRPPTPPLPSIDVKDTNGVPRKLQFVPCMKSSFEQLRGNGNEFRTLEVIRALPTIDSNNILCYLEFATSKEPGKKLKFKPMYTGRIIMRTIEDVYVGHPAIAKGFAVVSLSLANVCDDDIERVNNHKNKIVDGFNIEEREDYFPNIF